LHQSVCGGLGVQHKRGSKRAHHVYWRVLPMVYYAENYLVCRLHTLWTTDYMHTRQDRWIQTKLAFTLAKNATKPNPLEIIPLQTPRKENNWKTKETLERATVTLEMERIKGSSPWCLWWWWLFSLWTFPLVWFWVLSTMLEGLHLFLFSDERVVEAAAELLRIVLSVVCSSVGVSPPHKARMETNQRIRFLKRILWQWIKKLRNPEFCLWKLESAGSGSVWNCMVIAIRQHCSWP
jgi:hypothetical protein